MSTQNANTVAASGDQDLAGQVEPVQPHGDDDRLAVDEVALELAVEPRSARHVTR